MSQLLNEHWAILAFTNASTKTRVAHWQGLPFKVEICNDARIGILHNDNKRPAGGLALVLWQTRGLFLRGSTQSTNDVGHDMFPLKTGGYLLQCGSADEGETRWPDCIHREGRFNVD